MPRRKPPRDPEQTKKIIRALRDKFFTEDAKATAARALDRAERRHAAQLLAERAPSRPPTPVEPILPDDGEGFSESERDQAWAILHVIKAMYGPDAEKNAEDAAPPFIAKKPTE